MVSLYVEPEKVPSAVGPMIRTALFILVIELVVIGWVRWRNASRARDDLGGDRATSHNSLKIAVADCDRGDSECLEC